MITKYQYCCGGKYITTIMIINMRYEDYNENNNDTHEIK